MPNHEIESALPTSPPTALYQAVEEQLDRIRPGLVADGGNVELVAVDPEGIVRIVMQGECATCPAQLATIRIGIEEPLLAAVPGVTGVIPV